jgi:hypothetical protein
MILSIKDRLLLLNILPKESNFITLRLVNDLMNSLSFTEDEIAEALIQEVIENGVKTVRWDREKDIKKEFEFGEQTKKIIIDQLKELDEQKKITFDHFELCEKFLG